MLQSRLCHWPQRLARIGEVWMQNETGAAPYHQGWADGLRQLGYVEGQNLILLTRYADGDESRLPLLLNELIRLQVDVLVVSARAIRAAQKATTTIPIIYVQRFDSHDRVAQLEAEIVTSAAQKAKVTVVTFDGDWRQDT
jgi:hypothetical protein